MNWHRKRPAVFSGFTRAVSQLLRSHKGREERFSLGENYERRRGSPRISYARHLPRAACGSMAPPSSTGNPGSVYTNCETALAGKICIANPQ
jgi:hypothetical protein